MSVRWVFACGLALALANCVLPASFGPNVVGVAACQPNATVISGQSCSVACNAFYTATGTTNYTCGGGSSFTSTPTLTCGAPCYINLTRNFVGVGATSCPTSGPLMRGTTCTVACDTANGFTTANTGNGIFSCPSGGGVPTATTTRCTPCILPSPLTLHADTPAGCQAGGLLNASSQCDVVCNANYSRSGGGTQYQCSGTGFLTLATAICQGQPCPLPTLGTGVVRAGCANTIPTNTTCSVGCANGYVANGGSAAVYCGSLVANAPNLVCGPAPCNVTLTGTAGTLEDSCVLGSMLASGKACSLKCASGYEPQGTSLDATCDFGTLTVNIDCQPVGCAFPTSFDTGVVAGNTNPCRFNARMNDGDTCDQRCAPGYSPQVEKVFTCNQGVITTTGTLPPWCTPNTCLVNLGANEQGNPTGAHSLACVDGQQLSSSTTCDIKCDATTSPSGLGTFYYSCFAGTLTNTPSGQCIPMGGCYFPPLDPSYVLVSCTGGPLANATSCTVDCSAGNSGNGSLSNTFSCLGGSLTPPAKVCTPAPCTLPTMAAGVTGCVSGSSLPSGTSCTMGCGVGSVLSNPNAAGSQYSCNSSVLTQTPSPFAPATFCAPLNCVVPAVPADGYAFTAFLGRCTAGQALANSSTCYMTCATGYNGPFIGNLQCINGQLNYTFGCVPADCRYNVPSAANIVGWQGDSTGVCNQSCVVAASSTQNLLSGTCCAYNCASGYTFSSGAFQLACQVPGTVNCNFGVCDASPVSPSLVCTANPCTLPTNLGVGVTGTTCVAGGTLPGSGAGNSCTVGCSAAYQSAGGNAQYTCNLGNLTSASLVCVERNCSLPSPSLKNQLTGLPAGPHNLSCVPGDPLTSGTTCDVQCVAPFLDSANGGTETYSCVGAQLIEPTLVCVSSAQCALPNALGAGIQGTGPQPCAPPAYLDNATSCRVGCLPGYSSSTNPSSVLYNCSNGTLSPALLTCSPNPCNVTLTTPDAATGTCTNGGLLPSSQSCTSGCATGYTQMTITQSCSLGVLTPSGVCSPAPCTLPANFATGVQGSGGAACVEGNQLNSSGTCNVACGTGYQTGAGTTQYRCLMGNLTAPTLTCAPRPCTINLNTPDEIGDNSTVSPCADGQVLPSGQSCYVRCNTDAGFTGPQGYVRTCSLGQISPAAALTCSNAIPCVLPDFGPYVVSTTNRPCNDPGNTLAPGSICDVQCDPSGVYSNINPTPGAANRFRFDCSCGGGVLCNPYNFQCFPLPCSLPYDLGANTNASAGTCSPATRLDSGASCTVACQAGYSLSPAGKNTYTCQAGHLTEPATCIRVGMDCAVPDFASSHFVGDSQLDIFACTPGQILTSNTSCSVGCAATFSANSGSQLYSCKNGALTATPSLVCTGPPCTLPANFPAGLTSTQCTPGGSLAYNTNCTVSCAGPAYVPSNTGSNQYTCSPNLRGPSLRCSSTPCNLPATISPSLQVTGGTCKGGGTLAVNLQCTVGCAPGYGSTGAGSNLFACAAGSPLGAAPTLSSPTLQCTANSCSLPSPLVAGYTVVNCPLNSVSSQCTVQCASGFSSVLSTGVVGPVTATCYVNGGAFVLAGCIAEKQCSIQNRTGYVITCASPSLPSNCTGTTCASGYYGSAVPSCPTGAAMAFGGCTACRTTCPAGLTSAPCSSTSQPPCTNCTANTFNNGSSLACSPCPPNTCSQPGAAVCVACPPQQVTIGGDEGISDGALAAAIVVPLLIVGLIALAWFLKRRNSDVPRTVKSAKAHNDTEMGSSGTSSSSAAMNRRSDSAPARKPTDAVEMERGTDGLWRQKPKVVVG